MSLSGWHTSRRRIVRTVGDERRLADVVYIAAEIIVVATGSQHAAFRRRKLERNLRLLHLDHADRPNDAFTLFNLGWTFADLGRCGEAVPLLQHSLRHSHPPIPSLPSCTCCCRSVTVVSANTSRRGPRARRDTSASPRNWVGRGSRSTR